MRGGLSSSRRTGGVAVSDDLTEEVLRCHLTREASPPGRSREDDPSLAGGCAGRGRSTQLTPTVRLEVWDGNLSSHRL
jgi:hypothetical protein